MDENMNQQLKQYGTKLDPKTKKTLELMAELKGTGYGQRELLKDLVELYRKENPEIMGKIDQLIELMGLN